MTSPLSALEVVEKFGPDADWDAGAHVRLLRANGGPSSGYTADLIQNLHCTVLTLARKAEALERENAELREAMKVLAALDRMSRGVDWCDQDEQARRWEAARRVLEGSENAE